MYKCARTYTKLIHTALQFSGQVWQEQDNIYRMVARNCSGAVNLKQWLCCVQDNCFVPTNNMHPHATSRNTTWKYSMLSIQCRDREREERQEREMGGLLTYLRFSRKGCGHDRLVRNARHACLNTSPLLLSYLLTSILLHAFQPIFCVHDFIFLFFFRL